MRRATPPPASDAPLFVYGSLMRGQAAEGYLADRLVVPATTRGRLFRVPAGYPALVVDAAGQPIMGELVLDPTPGLFTVLDLYEGVATGLYRRELVRVTRLDKPRAADGQQTLFARTLHAWAYVVTPRQARTRRYHPLEATDWRKISRR